MKNKLTQYIINEVDRRIPLQTEQADRLKKMVFEKYGEGGTLPKAIKNTLEPWNVNDFLQLDESQRKTILNSLQV